MRHKKKSLLLNRFTSWRKATLVSMARNLLIQQRMKTTLRKAKAAQPLAELLISLAKENTLAAKRAAFRILSSHKLVAVLFNDVGPRFSKRTGGYTRIINLARRRGDDASMVIFELTEIKEKEKRPPEEEKEAGLEEEPKKEAPKKPAAEKKPEGPVAVKERPPITKKPTKKFLGGLRNIFKKERDSL